MSRTVWKFPLELMLALPLDAKILMAGNDPAAGGASSPTIWVELDPTAKRISREFLVLGTGHPVADNLQWHASYIDGEYVWHIYERT